ncbi:MAG: hypothetical protein PHY43_06405 [Verrucomicrobiales bacterium]|nr:hypothetical protein [Verrucomicrobiales bacterium]
MADTLQDLIASVILDIPVAADHLKSAREEICRQIDPEIDFYIRQQLDCIVNVAKDASFLATHLRFHNLSALCRLAFESRIHFLSAIKIEGYVARKFIKQTTEHIARLKAMASDSQIAMFVGEEVKRHESYLQTLLTNYSGIPERQWNLKEAATEIGLSQEYDGRYVGLSQAIHSTPAGLLTKDDPYIVASSLVFLFADVLNTIEFTIAPLSNGVSQGPLSGAWKELFDPLISLRKQEVVFKKRLNEFSTQEIDSKNNF